MKPSKHTRNPYVPPPTALLQPDGIRNEEVSDETERKAATCLDLRTSTEEVTTSEEAHEERGDTYAAYRNLRKAACGAPHVMCLACHLGVRVPRVLSDTAE